MNIAPSLELCYSSTVLIPSQLWKQASRSHSTVNVGEDHTAVLKATVTLPNLLSETNWNIYSKILQLYIVLCWQLTRIHSVVCVWPYHTKPGQDNCDGHQSGSYSFVMWMANNLLQNHLILLGHLYLGHYHSVFLWEVWKAIK